MRLKWFEICLACACLGVLSVVLVPRLFGDAYFAHQALIEHRVIQMREGLVRAQEAFDQAAHPTEGLKLHRDALVPDTLLNAHGWVEGAGDGIDEALPLASGRHQICAWIYENLTQEHDVGVGIDGYCETPQGEQARFCAVNRAGSYCAYVYAQSLHPMREILYYPKTGKVLVQDIMYTEGDE